MVIFVHPSRYNTVTTIIILAGAGATGQRCFWHLPFSRGVQGHSGRWSYWCLPGCQIFGLREGCTKFMCFFWLPKRKPPFGGPSKNPKWPKTAQNWPKSKVGKLSFLNKEKGGSEGGMAYFSACSVHHFKLFAHQINSHQWFSIPGCGVHRWASEEWRRVCSGGKQLLICSSIEINTTTMLSAICVYNVSARRRLLL